MRAEGLYLAAAGFSVAWWIGNVGVVRFAPGRRVEVYDPFGRWWWKMFWLGFLCHDGWYLFG